MSTEVSRSQARVCISQKKYESSNLFPRIQKSVRIETVLGKYYLYAVYHLAPINIGQILKLSFVN